MKYNKKIQHLLSISMKGAMAFVLLMAALPLSYTARAAEKDVNVTGQIYEFGEKSEYELSSSESAGADADHQKLGTCAISGAIVKEAVIDNIPKYEVADGELLTLTYRYDNSLLTADAEEWHLTEDNKKIVNGIKLDEKIGTGAIMLQTSLDGETWIVNHTEVNLVQPGAIALNEKTFQTNDIQLTNGCYYRIIVAYKTEIKTESTKILFVDKPNYEYKKYAEVYEFYAGYKKKESSSPDNERKYSLGTLVNTGKDNGYSGSDKIEGDDSHYGWELGNFFVSGYTEKTDDTIFLKNVGDKITLWFHLKQDITKLNGNSDLTIMEDKSGYDQQFQTPKTNFGHGALIIRYTDHEGVKHDPIIYENYLEALTSAGADVRVKLFEEGDYEVALDYKMKNAKGLGKTADYRISFEFKVRNGNCMIYPFDVATKSELADSSVTEHGFYLDLARSRYLKINVTMARWTKGANGYTEDIRYNRPAKDGDEYTDEGIYTIEVSNPSTGKTTEKKIYVGNDQVLKAAMNADNASYTINEISKLVEEGAEIQEDGTIILPTTEAVFETESMAETEENSATAEGMETEQSVSNGEHVGTGKTTADAESEEAAEVTAETDRKETNGMKGLLLILSGMGIAGGCGAAVMTLRKTKKK